MKEKVKFIDKSKLIYLELKEDRYIKIPKSFIKLIHLDNERNIILKSNNNVWFFEIFDKYEEKEIVKSVKVNIDNDWGFIVPLMDYQLDFKPIVKDFVFFNDENGIGLGNSASYIIWSNGKRNNEIIEKQGFKTMEELDDYISGELRKNREKYEKKNIR